MIQFNPYPSIGNAADAALMARVRENVEIGTLFAVQEKVDGANVSFLCDDLEVRMARRTAILDPLESFFGYQQVLERYSGHIYHIHNRLRPSFPEMTSIAVYGELFGGVFLPVLEANTLFSDAGLLYGFDGVVMPGLAKVRFCAEYTQKRLPIIGSGAITSPEEALALLQAGASLIEVAQGIPGKPRRTARSLLKAIYLQDKA